MTEADLVGRVIAGLGPAGATFTVMYAWLKSVRDENKALKAELADARTESIRTLERVLPLVASATEVVDANKREAERASRDRQEALLGRLEQQLGRLEG